MGGVCFRKTDAPDNAELVVGKRLCRGKCGCYKSPETTTPEMTQDCADVFAENGYNYSTFAVGSAHGIHGLSLEEIRYFFAKDAPEDNKIPTVNIDFSADTPVFLNAPLWGYENKYTTWALKIMDWFMLNDHPYIFTEGTTAIEKATHQYHMHEIYAKAAKIYEDLIKVPPKGNRFCSCVNDVEANGILSQIYKIADILKNGKMHEHPLYVWGGRKRSTDEFELLRKLKENFKLQPNQHNADKLLEVNPWTPGSFTGESDQWLVYSAMLMASLPKERGVRDFATFIYCKLNHP